MQTIIDRGQVDVFGDVEETSEFTIAATPFAYKILSDGLYSNKIRAVIRELSTNAYDAHVFLNKKDIPFDVQLPNSFSPLFSLRDYGPGMSKEDIMGLYTTYFKSGQYKIKSNDYVGCLGLGSKSPFAYTRSFNVTSFHNNIKTDYTLYINDKNIPTITVVNEEESDEQSGLLITIPVKTGDRYNFCKEAENIYKYFHVKPNISGSSSYDSTEVKYIYEGSNWKIRDNSNISGIQIIMGNIAYPVIFSSLNGLSESIKAIFRQNNINIDIFANIGDVSITPSREQLQYDELTNNFIKDQYNNIIIEVEQRIKEELKNCKSLWQARITSHKLLKSSLSIFKNISCLHSVMWNNLPLLNSFISLSDKQVVFSFSRRERYYRRRRYWGESNCSKTPQKERVISIYFNNDALIVENDVERGAFSRCKELSEQRQTTVYLIEHDTELIKALGCIPEDIIKASTLPKPQRKAITGHIYGSKSKVFALQTNIVSESNYKHWKETEIDLKDGGIYLVLDRYSPEMYEDNQVFPGWYTFDNMLLALKGLDGGVLKPIYGIRQSLTKKIGKNNKWISFWEYFKKRVNEEEINRKVSLCFVHLDEYNDFNYADSFEALLSYKDEISCPLFKQMFALLEQYHREEKDLQPLSIKSYTWLDICKIFDSKFVMPISNSTLSDIRLKIINKYPMLNYVMEKYSSLTSTEISQIIDYIKLVQGEK